MAENVLIVIPDNQRGSDGPGLDWELDNEPHRDEPVTGEEEIVDESAEVAQE